MKVAFWKRDRDFFNQDNDTQFIVNVIINFLLDKLKLMFELVILINFDGISRFYFDINHPST